MGMQKLAGDRDTVWAALVKCSGDRKKTAEKLGCSVRTLNRYIKDFYLYPDMEKLGFIQRPGPPRGDAAGTSRREPLITDAIRRHHGQLDYGELAVELYLADNDKNRQKVYIALNDLKMKGIIALDGVRWFVLDPIVKKKKN